jgi:hypothetical protein
MSWDGAAQGDDAVVVEYLDSIISHTRVIHKGCLNLILQIIKWCVHISSLLSKSKTIALKAPQSGCQDVDLDTLLGWLDGVTQDHRQVTLSGHLLGWDSKHLSRIQNCLRDGKI